MRNLVANLKHNPIERLKLIGEELGKIIVFVAGSTIIARNFSVLQFFAFI